MCIHLKNLKQKLVLLANLRVDYEEQGTTVSRLLALQKICPSRYFVSFVLLFRINNYFLNVKKKFKSNNN